MNLEGESKRPTASMRMTLITTSTWLREKRGVLISSHLEHFRGLDSRPM